jgi:hypothetical protein
MQIALRVAGIVSQENRIFSDLFSAKYLYIKQQIILTETYGYGAD